MSSVGQNLPGQYTCRSGFLAVVKVCGGEPSSEWGIRGLSTNFAFRSGASEQKAHIHTDTHLYREGNNIRRYERWRTKERENETDRDRTEDREPMSLKQHTDKMQTTLFGLTLVELWFRPAAKCE